PMVRTRKGHGSFVIAMLVLFAVCLSLAAKPGIAAGPLGTPGTPIGTTPISAGSTETVTSDISPVVGTGSGTITYALLASTGGAYGATGASCTPASNTLTCTYAPAAGSYTYKVSATDQTPTTTTSAASSSVTVTQA